MLADDSHAISCHIFFRKLGKMPQNLSSAAVVIGALRVNSLSLNDNLLVSALTLSTFYRVGPRSTIGSEFDC